MGSTHWEQIMEQCWACWERLDWGGDGGKANRQAQPIGAELHAELCLDVSLGKAVFIKL